MAKARYVARSRIEHGAINLRGKNVVTAYEAGDAVVVDAETAAALIAAGALEDTTAAPAEAPPKLAVDPLAVDAQAAAPAGGAGAPAEVGGAA